MTDISRRQAIALGAATVAAAMVPVAVAAPLESAVVPATAAGTLQAWAVGTPDEWDWNVFYAATEEEARQEWVEDQVGVNACEEPDNDPTECDCDYCHNFRSAEAERKPQWDNKNVKAGDATWFSAGMGAYCSRCNDETYRDHGGHAVKDEIVCEECMELADWDVIDPERAAEMRAEQAEIDA